MFARRLYVTAVASLLMSAVSFSTPPIRALAETCRSAAGTPTAGSGSISARGNAYCSPISEGSFDVTVTLYANGKAVAAAEGQTNATVTAACVRGATASYYSIATSQFAPSRSATVSLTCK